MSIFVNSILMLGHAIIVLLLSLSLYATSHWFFHLLAVFFLVILEHSLLLYRIAAFRYVSVVLNIDKLRDIGLRISKRLLIGDVIKLSVSLVNVKLLLSPDFYPIAVALAAYYIIYAVFAGLTLNARQAHV